MRIKYGTLLENKNFVNLIESLVEETLVNEDHVSKDDKKGLISFIVKHSNKNKEELSKMSNEKLYDMYCKIEKEQKLEETDTSSSGSFEAPLKMEKEEIVYEIILSEDEYFPAKTLKNRLDNENKAINDKAVKDTIKKIKDYTDLEKQKEKKVNKDVEKFIDVNRGMGLQDIVYDIEPSDKFKERFKEDAGEEIIDKAKQKREYLNKRPQYTKDVQPVIDVKDYDKIKDDAASSTSKHMAFESVKVKNIIPNLIENVQFVPKEYLVEGNKFKVTDGDRTVEFLWENNEAHIEKFEDKSKLKEEFNLFNRISGFKNKQKKLI